MSLYTMLESTGTLIRPRITRDGAGGVVQTFDHFIAQDVPCSVQPASATTKLEYAQKQMDVNATVYTATALDARPSDVFDVYDAKTAATHRFQVVGISPNIFQRRLAPFAMNCLELS